jgi:hypothetical protein
LLWDTILPQTVELVLPAVSKKSRNGRLLEVIIDLPKVDKVAALDKLRTKKIGNWFLFKFSTVRILSGGVEEFRNHKKSGLSDAQAGYSGVG